MRNLFKKSLAFCLVLALALSCFVGAITVNAETYDATISVSAEPLETVPETDTSVPVTLEINSPVAINIAKLVISLTGGLTFDAEPVAGSEDYEITEISDDYSAFYVDAVDGEVDGNTVFGGYTSATVTLSVLVPAYTPAGSYAINVATAGVNASTPDEEAVNLVYDGLGAILIATEAEGPVVVVRNNPVVVDGSIRAASTNETLRPGNDCLSPDFFDVAYGSKYTVTYKGGAATDGTMYEFYMNNGAEPIILNNPAAVNGLSFKLKVNGLLPKFGIYLDNSGSRWYLGEIKAYDTKGNLVATKPAGNSFIFKADGGVALPENFEGTIVIGNTEYRTPTGNITFEQYYNDFTFTGLQFAAALPTSVEAGSVFIEYDDLRIISDDLDDYIASLSGPAVCEHPNTTTSEKETKAATCTEAGTKTVTVTCDDCGKVVSTTEEEIPATGEHNYVIGVCDMCGAIDPAIPVIPVAGNPVVVNGSVRGISTNPVARPEEDCRNPEFFDVTYSDKYVVTYKGGIDASAENMYEFFMNNGALPILLDNPAAVNGLSFKLKVKGQLPKFGIYLDNSGSNWYLGEIKAYDTAGNLVATKPAGNPFIFQGTLPADFEGTIVIGNTDYRTYPNKVQTMMTFEEYYNNYKFTGVQLAAAIPKNAVADDFFIEYDNLRVISDDLDTYVASLATPADCEHANYTISEEVTKAATCGEAGTKTITVTCDDCGEVVSTTENIEIPATGEHNYVDGACDVCGAIDPEAPVPCEHANTTTTEEVTEPTCSEVGTKVTTVTCDDCGKVVSTTEEEIPATGEHNYVLGACDECGAIDPELPVISVTGNPVVVDGSVRATSTNPAVRPGDDCRNPEFFDVTYGDKYVATYLGGIDAAAAGMYEFYMNNGALPIVLDNPAAVNGLSFKLKVKGQLPKFGIYLDNSGSNWYLGEIKAYDTAGNLVATKPAGNPFIFQGTLPADFEGTIVIGNTDYRTYPNKVQTMMTFEEYYNNYNFTGVQLAAAIPKDAVAGDMLMEYYDLTVISDDLDTYVASLAQPAACEHANKYVVGTTPATSSTTGVIDFECPDCDKDDEIDETVLHNPYDLLNMQSLSLRSEISSRLYMNKALLTAGGKTFDPANGDKILAVFTQIDPLTLTTNTVYHSLNDAYDEIYSGKDCYGWDVTCLSIGMADQIDTTIYVLRSGVWYTAGTYQKSIMQGALNMYNTAPNDAFRTLIVDMLNYGAAAQIAFNYNKDNLPNATLTAEQKAFGTSSDVSSLLQDQWSNPVNAQEALEQAQVLLTGKSISLNENIALNFNFSTTYYIASRDLNNLSVKVTHTDGFGDPHEKVYVYKDVASEQQLADGLYFEVDTSSGKANRYKFTYFDLTSVDMTKPVTVTFYDGTTKASVDVVYSVQSLAYHAIVDDSLNYTAEQKALVNELIEYGNSATNYFINN